MYKRYYRKKDPLCQPAAVEWVEMGGKEFYTFMNAPENQWRKFIDMGTVVLECTEAQAKDFTAERDRAKYLRSLEEGREALSLYYLESDSGCNGEEVIADPAVCVEDVAIKNIRIASLRKAIVLLSEEDRILIELKYLSDTPLSQERIGEILGISQSTASRRLTAAEKNLKNLCIKVEKIPQQKVRGKT